MKKTKIVIIGAGVGGLSAGCWLKSFKNKFLIVEKLPEIPFNLNNGVHYLHSIPELPFIANLKEITLTDGILTEEGRIRHIPELQDALQYSEKVRSIQHPSSIYEVGKRESVYIPKSNNINDYIQELVSFLDVESFELEYNIIKIDLNKKELITDNPENNIQFEKIISTIPLGILIKLTDCGKFENLELNSTPINVLNFKAEKIVPNWLINLYIPSIKQKIYRASILNNIVSIESICKIPRTEYGQVKELLNMFYLNITNPREYNWREGKIVSINIDIREKILQHFTKFNVFPIGRFGLWNNKLLIDTTINQAHAVCKYFNFEKPKEIETNWLINFLAR